jgi:hypothetical protein
MDDLGLKVSEVYSIPCECGQMGQSIETRCKEHTRHLHLYQPEKSVVVKHSIKCGHEIKFKDTETSAKTAGYMDWLEKEAIET